METVESSKDVSDAASVVIERSGGRQRARRHSRRKRSTPLLFGGGLQFHYVIGILLALSFVVVLFGEPLSAQVYTLLQQHPHSGPMIIPWWQHAGMAALLFAFVVWLYLIPGVWDRFLETFGLKKNEERRARRRSN